MKYLYYVIAVVIGVALGFALGQVLASSRRSAFDAPPSDSNSRVIDSIRGASIIDYFGYRSGPARYERYIQDAYGLRPLSLGGLSGYISLKYENRSISRDAAVREFIRLHNMGETILLSSSKDIPSFKPDQLDPDLRGLTLAPVEIQNPVRGQALFVVYTWTQANGELKRYRFMTHTKEAHDTPYCFSCVTLQTEVGDFKMLAWCPAPASRMPAGVQTTRCAPT